jgi:hypothetical protein
MPLLLPGFFSTLLLAALASAIPAKEKARITIVDCLDQYNVPYADKSSPNWTALITPYNLRLPYVPAVVTIPTTPDQVSSSITCAAAYGLKVQPKGGGHSYASYSSGGQNGSLIVDMEKFSSITVNQSKCCQNWERIDHWQIQPRMWQRLGQDNVSET